MVIKDISMQVKKRNGSMEPVNLDKIVKSIEAVATGLDGVDVFRIAQKTVGGLVHGVTTRELDMFSIRNAAGLIIEDPVYSKVAARIMHNVISKEVSGQDIQSFSQSISLGYEMGLIDEQTYNLVMNNKRKLNASIKTERSDLFEFHGIITVYDRYLLKHRDLMAGSGTDRRRAVIETPQYFFMRVACGLANDAKEAVELYNLVSSLEYMTSTPTLFNSGTSHTQMSSCYLLDSPNDDLQDIYKRYSDIASLSKFAGGIGVSASRIRSKGSPIKGTNGRSNGIIPWLHTLSGSVGAVNQGGKRKGAACVYLEPHHADVMQFLELRDQTGEKERRAYNLNIANWVSDLFMSRVKNDEIWSLFDPADVPELVDLYGDEYTKRYLELEEQGKFVEQISARKIYARMMRTLAETGNGWMCFKDTSNNRGNQVGEGRSIKLSNLCFAPDTIIHAKLGDKVMDIEIKALSDYFSVGIPVQVWSFNEETHEMEWKNVVNAGLTNPDAELMEIETPSGKIIRCTEDHPMLTERGWVNAGDLTEDDSLVEVDTTQEVHKFEHWNKDKHMVTEIIMDHLYSKNKKTSVIM